MSETEKLASEAIAAALAALSQAPIVKEADEEGHVHSLADGSITGEAYDVAQHVHAVTGGLFTSPPYVAPEGHYHLAPDGTSTGPEMPEPMEDSPGEPDEPVLPSELEKVVSELPFGKLPVLRSDDAAFIIERLRKGNTAGIISKRRSVARLGDPQALVSNADGIQKIYAIVAQGGPVTVSKMAALDSVLFEGLGENTRASSVNQENVFYISLRPLALFDPPLFVKSSVTKELDFSSDLVSDQPSVATDFDFTPVEMQESRVVQTLIFDKASFSAEDAVRWARNHDFRADKVDTAENSVRLRQKDPGRFKEGTLRTIDITDGIKAVVGVMKADQSVEMIDNDPAHEATALASHEVRVVKFATEKSSSGEERIVFGVVLVPEETDSHGDIYDAETVRHAAHSFMENGGVRKIMHKGEPVTDASVLETYLTRSTEVHMANGTEQSFPVGTWMMAMRINSDELWEKVLKGEFTGFSMGGTALRRPLDPQAAI
jgi:hypothetical protein